MRIEGVEVNDKSYPFSDKSYPFWRSDGNCLVLLVRPTKEHDPERVMCENVKAIYKGVYLRRLVIDLSPNLNKNEWVAQVDYDESIKGDDDNRSLPSSIIVTVSVKSQHGENLEDNSGKRRPPRFKIHIWYPHFIPIRQVDGYKLIYDKYLPLGFDGRLNQMSMDLVKIDDGNSQGDKSIESMFVWVLGGIGRGKSSLLTRLMGQKRFARIDLCDAWMNMVAIGSPDERKTLPDLIIEKLINDIHVLIKEHVKGKNAEARISENLNSDFREWPDRVTEEISLRQLRGDQNDKLRFCQCLAMKYLSLAVADIDLLIFNMDEFDLLWQALSKIETHSESLTKKIEEDLRTILQPMKVFDAKQTSEFGQVIRSLFTHDSGTISNSSVVSPITAPIAIIGIFADHMPPWFDERLGQVQSEITGREAPRKKTTTGESAWVQWETLCTLNPKFALMYFRLNQEEIRTILSKSLVPERFQRSLEDRLLMWTNGHPYLVTAIMEEYSKKRSESSDMPTITDYEPYIDQIIFSEEFERPIMEYLVGSACKGLNSVSRLSLRERKLLRVLAKRRSLSEIKVEFDDQQQWFDCIRSLLLKGYIKPANWIRKEISRINEMFCNIEEKQLTILDADQAPKFFEDIWRSIIAVEEYRRELSTWPEKNDVWEIDSPLLRYYLHKNL